MKVSPVKTPATSVSFLEWLNPTLNLPAAFRRQVFTVPAWQQIVIALMLNIMSLALPIMMLQIYDRIIPHKAFNTLVMLLAGVLITLMLDATLRMARAWLISWMATTHEYASGDAAMARITRADLPTFKHINIGTHLQNWSALSRLREFYSGQTLTALVDLPFVIVFLFLIGYLGGALAIVPVVLLTGFILFASYAGQRLKYALEARTAADDSKASYLVSILGGIHTVKALGMEMPLLSRFEAAQKPVTTGSYQVALASGLAATLSAGFGQLSLILVATIGSLFVIHGDLSVGGLSACTLLAGRVLQPVQRVLGTWLRLQDIALSRAQANALLNMPVQERSAENLPVPEGRIKLQNISFGFGDDLLLQNVNLDIEPGAVIAIAGEKGSGKSVLLQMMTGVLTPLHGEVMLDGIAPHCYSMGELQSHVGYLPQQGVIFKGTILENLTGFADDEMSIAAAKETGRALGLEAVINVLPAGYETRLEGSPSDPLPPGVKQRITLARVLRHKPALLLFDDADRALDKEGYNLLFRMIGAMKGGCTIVMVSHDQNLLSFADQFYQLQNGILQLTPATRAQNLSLLVPGKERRA
jgi:ATP-binding cassette subfamily C protein LapB